MVWQQALSNVNAFARHIPIEPEEGLLVLGVRKTRSLAQTDVAMRIIAIPSWPAALELLLYHTVILAPPPFLAPRLVSCGVE